jgi:hypothetical protein
MASHLRIPVDPSRLFRHYKRPKAATFAARSAGTLGYALSPNPRADILLELLTGNTRILAAWRQEAYSGLGGTTWRKEK